MNVKIVNNSKHSLPHYATEGSAGMDICANLEKPVTIHIGKRAAIPTGIHVEVPKGYCCDVRPRSGLALKRGITCLNSPGTIDSDYRGEIHAILVNHGEEMFTVNDGERVAQLVFLKHEPVKFILVDELTETKRGSEGFGSTGK